MKNNIIDIAKERYSKFKPYINQIIKGDCLDVMKEMPDDCIDLVVTSPPYDNLRNYDGNVSDWNHNKFMAIANELKRILKQGGVIVWVVNDKTEKGTKTGTSFKQALYFKEIGLNINDTMIWRKTNPMPQVKQPRYNQVFEYMFIFSKGLPKVFNPIKVPTKCGGQVYDSTCKNMGGENGRTKKNFIINKEKVKDNVWDIAIARNKTKHPAVFPIQIPLDHIETWTDPMDVVLDPFVGSGTTALAAYEKGRIYVGIEKNEEYCKIAEERLNLIKE